jgi:DNA-binding IclR family transcriptional regulator
MAVSRRNSRVSTGDRRAPAADAASPGEPVYAVPSVDKVLDIFELLSFERVPLTRAQIARALGRSPSELFRLLTVLERRHYVRRDETSGGYSLTLRLFELGRTHSTYDELLRAAASPLRQLTAEIRESSHLSVIFGNKVLVLAQEMSPQPFRASVEVGSLHPIIQTASGRVLLAAMAEDERMELLNDTPEFHALSATRRTELLRRIEAIREHGYEHLEGEWMRGATDLGISVGAPSVRAKAALVVTVLRDDASPDRLLPPMRACADAIARAAGTTAFLHQPPAETPLNAEPSNARNTRSRRGRPDQNDDLV